MSENLRKLGSFFKDVRLQKNLSLKDVEAAIFVREGYLRAIEDGTIDQQINSVYVYGFVNQYANFLEIDMQALLKENPSLLELRPHVHEFSYGIGTLEPRHTVATNSSWLPNLIWISLFSLGIIGVWFLLKYLGVI